MLPVLKFAEVVQKVFKTSATQCNNIYPSENTRKDLSVFMFKGNTLYLAHTNSVQR